MPQTSATLAALIGSRLCHDLISPIGAIQNGLELIALSGGADEHSPEMALIQDSCNSAAARIKFFRVAFGSAESHQSLGSREAAATLAANTEGSRLSAEWLPQGDFRRQDVQLAFLAFLCCESALPVGGNVRLDRDAAGWSVTATGRRIALDEIYWDHLNGVAQLGEIAPNRVQFALLALLADERGQKIMVTCNETQITIKIA